MPPSRPKTRLADDRFRDPAAIGTTSLALRPQDIGGASLLDYVPLAGQGCRGPISANTTPSGEESFQSRPNSRIGLPVPLVIGAAAKTCYTQSGGGTYWFAVLGNPDPTIETRLENEVVYFAIPSPFSLNPKPGLYCSNPPRSQFDMNYNDGPGGGSHTEHIDWSGLVYVKVPGVRFRPKIPNGCQTLAGEALRRRQFPGGQTPNPPRLD